MQVNGCKLLHLWSIEQICSSASAYGPCWIALMSVSMSSFRSKVHSRIVDSDDEPPGTNTVNGIEWRWLPKTSRSASISGDSLVQSARTDTTRFEWSARRSSAQSRCQTCAVDMIIQSAFTEMSIGRCSALSSSNSSTEYGRHGIGRVPARSDCHQGQRKSRPLTKSTAIVGTPSVVKNASRKRADGIVECPDRNNRRGLQVKALCVF